MSAFPEIQPRDVLDRLMELARFTGRGPGVTRLMYDEAWCAAHRWLSGEAKALGLAATADWAGNLFFHPPALEAGRLDQPALMVGSHLDSVKQGGRLDGAYGVIAGLLTALAHAGRPGLPVVGTSGTAARRLAVVTARARSLPALMCGTTEAMLAKLTVTSRPPSRSAIAGALPL